MPDSMTRDRIEAEPRCRLALRSAMLSAVVVLGAAPIAAHEPALVATEPVYTQSVDAFVSAKGERAMLAGYARGIEVWAYPLQLMRDYHLRFHVAGQVAPLEGSAFLRRVDRFPTETMRVYVGPDFIVRERLFVPTAAAGAIIEYEVTGRPEVKVEVVFRPALDLMWPAALGGQSVGWDQGLSAYVEREPLHGFTATIGSTEAVAHDDIVNRTQPSQTDLSLLLEPRATEAGGRTATLAVAADAPGAVIGALAAALRSSATQSRREAAAHADAVLAGSLRIITPDAAVNRALASATLALDQAWVCNPALGCGAVAGYGPSRPGRRPQYAWFFAGDGLVAMQAMLDAGQHARARQELAFVARYQNKRTGMIWHEISQSAALIDWQNKYPYMFVHVDITFQYLASVQSYVDATGDIGFARDHWAGIAAAYRYCTSVIDPGTGLPQIPEGKQGQNEQAVMRDDIRLSSAWIDAADGFAGLARATGHARLATDAETRAARARKAIARDGWDEASGFWLSGHTRAGAPIHDERPDASEVLDQGVFTPARIDTVLDRIASPEFMTDWGVRNLSANAPDYDPNLYGNGSVWGLGSASAALTFWKRHRPLTAWSIWTGLAGWDTLDSGGHLHEVLAGDLFHPEVESVPEQTWSSAGFLTSATRGLLGIEVHASDHLLRLAPHLPATWPGVTVQNIRVGTGSLAARIERDASGISLKIDNPGPAVTVEFAPAVPLGATVVSASVGDAPIRPMIEAHPQDQHARLRFTAGTGMTRARIAYAGGIEIAALDVPPAVGDASRNPRIVTTRFADNTLTIDAWTAPPERATLDLFTSWRIDRADGATVEQRPGQGYRIAFAAEPVEGARTKNYRRVRAVIRFVPVP